MTLMMLWQKGSMLLKSVKRTVCVCLPVNASSATTQSQRFKKETHCFWMFLYEFEYIPRPSPCSTVPLSVPGRYNESSPWERREAHGGIFLRGHWFTQSPFIPKKHFVEMKSVIKLERTSARDAPGELWEELLFPSVGCISIGWQRRVHLRVERRLTLPATGAKDEMWERWWETSQFLLSLKRILS